MNRGYQRSRSREISLKNELTKGGWLAFRSAGSKGVADVIAIRPTTCGLANHFEVRLIQIKVSEKLKNKNTSYQIGEAPFGEVNLELVKFPVKSKKWFKKYAKRKPAHRPRLSHHSRIS